MSRRLGSLLVISVVAALGMAGIATASPVAPRRAALPKPGTPSQVTALVAASSKIVALPNPLLPLLQNAANDNASNYYPVIKNQCFGTKQCVFGDTSAKTTVVLFGDSHAAMWLPPLIYVAKQLKFRVILVWYSGCPAADVSVYDASQHDINKGCNTWRSQSIADIKKLAPSVVLLSDRTTSVLSAAGVSVPDATWKSGMEQTLSELAAPKRELSIIGDVTTLDDQMPECLAAHPSHIQDCSVPNPNPGYKTHVADEEAAAKAEKVDYINPQGWLCTKKCSPVVGNMVVYFDILHVTATYAEYLAIDFEDGIKPLLPAG
jgi:hypothetical protein